MNRLDFLEKNEGFVNWLVNNLGNQKFHLNMKPSRFVPGGLNAAVTGFPNLLSHYSWRSSWNNPLTNQPVVSQDWKSTVSSLGSLRQWTTRALARNDQQDVFDACLEVLRWGGVRGAIPFLKQLKESNLLVKYLTDLSSLMKLDGDPSQTLNALNKDSIWRFDAGLTKIHALIDVSGSPIYDSRVGAAMAMLYSLYYASDSKSRSTLALKFPSGSARGNQIRNPGELHYLSAPQFFTKAVTSEEWARWQVRLGWILRAVLRENDWFLDEGDIAARCHAFEACLFMIGYDLRCFQSNDDIVSIDVNNRTEKASKSIKKMKTGWVPSGHPFDKVIKLYLKYRESETGNHSILRFKQWMGNNTTTRKNTTLSKATIDSYCFPFKENEFDISRRSLNALKTIADGGENGLYTALGTRESYTASDEREQVCLVDAWIAGQEVNFNGKEQGPYNARLVRAGFAGTNKAANTLLAVGRNVGKHFGLLNKDNVPTKFYADFFCNGMDDLALYLRGADGDPT
jgi:hypothetical protein